MAQKLPDFSNLIARVNKDDSYADHEMIPVPNGTLKSYSKPGFTQIMVASGYHLVHPGTAY